MVSRDEHPRRVLQVHLVHADQVDLGGSEEWPLFFGGRLDAIRLDAFVRGSGGFAGLGGFGDAGGLQDQRAMLERNRIARIGFEARSTSSSESAYPSAGQEPLAQTDKASDVVGLDAVAELLVAGFDAGELDHAVDVGEGEGRFDAGDPEPELGRVFADELAGDGAAVAEGDLGLDGVGGGGVGNGLLGWLSGGGFGGWCRRDGLGRRRAGSVRGGTPGVARVVMGSSNPCSRPRGTRRARWSEGVCPVWGAAGRVGMSGSGPGRAGVRRNLGKVRRQGTVVASRGVAAQAGVYGCTGPGDAGRG